MTRLKVAIPLALALLASPALADDGRPLVDRVEDRVDRVESRYDRRHDHGRLDVIEDRIDAAESVLDRRGIEGPAWLDRHERRSWKRLVTPK